MFHALEKLVRRGTIRQRRRFRPWRLEQLEDRAVPAGDVFVGQFGDLLFINGDDLGNSIQLHPGDNPGDIVITGVDTTINGSTDPMVVSGVGSVNAFLLGGNDSLVAEGVTISSTSSGQVLVDGGAGDDQIEFNDSSISAAGSIDVHLYGEYVFGTYASGSTGNDQIELSGTTITGRQFITVGIYGELNEGGVVTGGNDTITIADSKITAAGFSPYNIHVDIYGDSTFAVGGETSVVGEGNDRITIENSTIAGSSAFPVNEAVVAVNIVGDSNTLFGFDPNNAGADAVATVGAGNDSIAVTGSTISSSAPSNPSSEADVTIIGDQNLVNGFVPDVAAVATIGGGNDRITLEGSSISASGSTFGFNGAVVEIRGEDIQVSGTDGENAASVIGGGDDRIAVSDVSLNAADSFSSDAAQLIVRSEFTFAFGSGVSTVGGGNDAIELSNVQVAGNSSGDLREIRVESGSGNDRVAISNSSARSFAVDLGVGNDRLDFESNVIGLSAFLDGGDGTDHLSASNNLGTLNYINFESIDVSP